MGNYFRPSPPFTGGTVSGDTYFLGSLSAGTIYSGSTNLYEIFATIGDISYLQNEINQLSGDTSGFTLSSTFNSYTALTHSQLNTKANLSGATFTGNVNTPSLSATTLSGGTIFSGSTNLYEIFTKTGDTNNLQIEINNLSSSLSSYTSVFSFDSYTALTHSQLNTKANLSGATFTGQVSTPSLSATTLSGGTIFSGSTDLSDIFATQTSVNNIQNSLSAYTTNIQFTGYIASTNSSLNNQQTQINHKLDYSGGTVTGQTIFSSGLSANTLSGGTIFSGGTNIYNIFAKTGDTTNLQNQINQISGGTSAFTQVSVFNSYTGLTNSQLNTKANLSGANFTGIIESGGTDLYNIFLTTADGNDITRLQPGLNTYTGGSQNNPSVNISGISIDNLAVSGLSSFFSLSSSTIFSGSTELGSLLTLPIYAQLNTKANLSGATFTGQVNASSLSTTTISGETYFSGSTPLTTIINNIASQYSGGSVSGDYLPLSGGTVTGNTIFTSGLSVNILTGGTIFSGETNINSLFADKIHSHLQYATLSGANFTGIIQSGGTDLYDIFLTTDDGNDITRLQPGLNTYTGGTENNPNVNISGLTIDNLVVSGLSSFFSLSATTIFSGSTELGTLLTSPIYSQLNTKANLSGATFTGQVNASSLSATTLSGETYFSGSTPLTTIIQNIASQYASSGGTATGNFLPLSGGTVTGDTTFTAGLTANTIFATTYLGLPVDVFVTGGTYTGATIIFTNNTGGTFSVTGITSGGESGTSPISVVNTSSLFSSGLSNTGLNASGVSNSIFFGNSAGQQATNASGSNFFGFNAGRQATSASNSNFFGSNAGNGATGASASNFFGLDTGQNATSALLSNFFGNNAGNGAINASNSNFFGQLAGNGATGANQSNFFGNNAGNGARNANQSNFLGTQAGLNAISANLSNFFGNSAGNGATNASNSNFFGPSAGLNAISANLSNFFGQNAGNGATNASNSNFFGSSAGNGATGASSSNFFGSNAGNGATNASNSNLFGFNVGRTITGNNLGSNNIIIGTNISLPNATANAINIGGVLFGTGTHSTIAGNPLTATTANGRIGIGVVTPTNRLHVFGEAANDSGLRLERLTSASPFSTGQTIGVDSSGNVVAIDTGSVSGNYVVNSGLTNLYSIPVSAYTCAFYDYTVSNVSGARAGNIMSVFSGTSVQFTETSTLDIGSTTGVTFSVSISSGNAVLVVSATTNNWTVKTIIRRI